MSDVQVVPVKLPARVWGRLATVADNRGTTISGLLAETIAGLLPVETPLEVLDAEVSAARAAGFRVPRRNLTDEDRAWLVEQRRQKVLSTYRGMTDEWTEIPA